MNNDPMDFSRFLEPELPLVDFSQFLEPELPPPAVIGIEKISVLTCLHGQARKKITPAKTHDFRIGKWFRAEQRAANSVFDLADILIDLQTESQSFIVRGQPTGPQRDHILRRSRGEDATFRDDPVHWVCLDVDSQGTVIGPPAAELRDLIEGAPQLAGTTAVCQVSSSWGIKPGIRAHIWFWLQEPRTSQQVGEWAASLPFKVDHALFSPVQPHYTADPEFEGVTDPLAGVPRVFVLKGAESDALYIPAGTAQAELDHWVEVILGLEDDDPRHPVVNRAAYSLGGWVGAGTLTAADVEDSLAGACIDSGVFDESRIVTIRDEIQRAVADGARRPRQCEDWKAGMIRSKEGAIKPLPDNYLRLFRTHPAMAGVLGYDVRTDRAMILKAPPWAVSDKDKYPRSIRDTDDTEAAAWANRIGLHTSAVTQISAALSAAATSNPFDRVVDWLEGLPAWDRESRLYSWLPRVTGCKDSLYSRAVGGKFILSLVARAFRPGCKVDNMLVLVGEQGVLKSTLLSAIVGGPGRWAFSDCLGDIRRPQDYMPTLMGPWLVEVAELSAFSKREVESVKKFLSTQQDRYRMSYGRRAVDIPRRGCVAGTSNTDDFLSDVTGNRRFWPIDVQRLDIGAFVQDREQIFAEAVYRYGQGDVWYLEGDEMIQALAEQERHCAIDSWEDQIREYVDAPPIFGGVNLTDPEHLKIEVTTLEIVRDCLQIPTAQATIAHSRRVAGILKRIGWRRTRPRVGGHRMYVYQRPIERKVEDVDDDDL